ncbi:hypothetical protein HDU67_008200 [Dinochytrium kinnereticum]|nr:hypothetical protein HDU67_008200 [Dinochytrium kinnereticum]
MPRRSKDLGGFLQAGVRSQDGHPQASSLLSPRPRSTALSFGDGTPGVRTMTDNLSSSVRRGTLTRPERHRRVRSMLRNPSAGPPAARIGATSNRNPSLPRTVASTVYVDQTPEELRACPCNSWVWFSRVLTCCFFPPILRFFGMKNPAVQQAWREKVALCMIILFWCFLVGFLTFGLKLTLCPTTYGDSIKFFEPSNISKTYLDDSVIVSGFAYNYRSVAKKLIESPFKLELNESWKGRDITKLFRPTYDYCAQFLHLDGYDCRIRFSPQSPAIPSDLSSCPDVNVLRYLPKQKIYFEWNNIANVTGDQAFFAFNGIVMNAYPFLQSSNRGKLFAENSTAFNTLLASIGRDGTKAFYFSQETINAVFCFQSRYTVGYVDKVTPGCFAADLILTVSLITILSLVFSRFMIALAFYWCLSSKYSRSPGRNRSEANHYKGVSGSNEVAEVEEDPFVIMLVTCYSEGEESIRSTLDSLASAKYAQSRKLLFVVADGMITGSGNSKSTPETILDMMHMDEDLPQAHPVSYVAIADGSKQHNQAYIHAGYYKVASGDVPTIVVVKCGTADEATSKKPGNRGKRDSQLILMNFLSRCVFDDLMTELDFELFYRINHITSMTPDVYEYILMVDADTKVDEMALFHMIKAMKSDGSIMGLCGETRISNKTDSWVSMIQVFEYYISHHLGKAFESVFGGVTCLPGCFCMFRVKAPKGPDGYFVPILVNPDIVEEYSENVVDTLHKKNLLLLGEDRFLSTLMLRTFPKRKMVFVPKAICRTVVPDEFKVLLSQRRRWINSTIHNLLELVLVRDLCGVFCFSMQFVVLLELLGTVVLPAAISFTIYIIIKLILAGSVEIIPVLMLVAILGLPGFLIVITSAKLVYVGWMLVYLLALPVWNFVLPVYAFWHFDDFSWGETRKIEGEGKGEHHGEKEGRFDPETVELRRWEEWERDRRVRLGTHIPKVRISLFDPPTDEVSVPRENL